MHTVYIVGAGPGDPELLTLKAYRLLTGYAEIVVYDRLIPEALLEMIPDGVTKVYAGKSCKKHHMTQAEINQELARYAKGGRKVVRLKGGDPFIFGRGGEEALHLKEQGIPFEVVSGVSAASGIAARFNIPLTHRGLANGVCFITGHQQNNEPVVQDWDLMARSDMTIVVYMGLANLAVITEKLMAHGLDPQTPSMIIEEGTCANERSAMSPLERMAATAREREFGSPSLVIIGKVVSLAKALTA